MILNYYCPKLFRAKREIHCQEKFVETSRLNFIAAGQITAFGYFFAAPRSSAAATPAP